MFERGNIYMIAALCLLFGCGQAAGALAGGGAAGRPAAVDPKNLSVYSVPLRPEKYQGVLLTDDGLALMDEAIVQVEDDFIVIEGEDALEYQFQQYIGVMKAGRSTKEGEIIQEYAGNVYEYGPQDDETKEASGGKFVDFVNVGTYSFTVTKPGKYTVWGRHWMPYAGFWCYYHQIDDQVSERINMPVDKDGIKKWWWNKCKTFELTPGTHTLQIAQLCNGKRLDKLILTTDETFTPEGVSKMPVPKQAIPEGWVEFETIEPAGLTVWGGIKRSMKLFRGTVSFDVSLDGGKSWRALPPDNAIPDEMKAARALRFRANLKRSEDRPSPLLEIPRVDFMVDEGRFATLENEYYRLSFDRETGCPVRILNRKTGADICDPGLRSDFVSVFIKKKNEEGEWLPFAGAKFVGLDVRKNDVTATYTFLDGKIRAACNVAVEDGMESLWKVEIENKSDFDVLSVRFPEIGRIALDGDPADDILLWPNLGGMFYAVPARLETKEGGYPGHLGSGYLDIFDETGGFSIATDDRHVVSQRLCCEPGRDKRSVKLRWEKRHRIKPEAAWTYAFRVGVHPGNWHDAAELYRKSFYAKFPKPDYPDWLIESDGWVYGGQLGSGHEERWYDEVRGTWLGALYFGCDYTQIWGSTFSGACPTYYLPRKECGGEEVFTKYNKMWRDAGGKIGYYFHGNAIGGAFTLMDRYYKTDWSEYPEELRAPSWQWYVENRNYPTEDMTVEKKGYLDRIERWQDMNRGDNQSANLHSYPRMSFLKGEFLKWLAFWTDRYILDYRTNTIYYDTMAWGADVEEFNPYGDWHGEGDIAMVKMKFLEDNNRRLREKEPEFAQLTEGCGDLWNIYCFSMLSGFTRHGTTDVIRYTFPEMVFYEGNANGRWGDETHKTSLAAAFLMGNRYDCIIRSDYSDDLFRLRQLISPLIARARFMSEIGIDRSDSTVRARGHVFDHEGTVGTIVTVWNEQRAQDCVVSVKLAHYGAPKRYYMVEHGGGVKKADVKIADGVLEFVASPASCSALVGIERVAPERAIACAVRFDGKDVVIAAANYAGEDVKTKISVAAEGIAFKKAVQEIVLSPGMNELRITPEIPADLALQQICTIDVEWQGGGRRYLTWCGPVVDDGGFENTHNFSAIRDFAYEGNFCQMVGESDKSMQPAFAPFDRELKKGGGLRKGINARPDYRYRFSFAAKGDVRNAYLDFDKKFTDTPGRFNFKKTGTDKGWDIYSVEFDGRGPGSFYVRGASSALCFIDGIRAEIVGPAQKAEK